jgi:hypothetical protein
METLRGKYRVRSPDVDMQVSTGSAVLSQTFVAESLQREGRRDDGLNAFRGAVNGVLISLAFWAMLGLVIFAFS